MKPNEINPLMVENKPAVGPENVEAAAEAKPDLCKMQYYCPQPILCARLAHAYVPFQYLCCLYPPEKGLQQGTIFPELDRPYGTDPEYMVDQ